MQEWFQDIVGSIKGLTELRDGVVLDRTLVHNSLEVLDITNTERRETRAKRSLK